MFDDFPYTNFHELNLDWIIALIKKTMKTLDTTLTDAIKLADPPDWNAERNYPKASLVFHDNIGYIAKKDVPAGTLLTNTEYWEEVINLGSIAIVVDELEERMDDAEQDITNLKGRVNSAEGYINSLSNRMTTTEGNITTLTNRMNTAESDITNLKGRMNTAENNISSLSGRMTTAESNISSLGGRLTSAESNISSLGGRLTSAENKINALDSSSVKNNSVKKMLYVGDSYSTWYTNALFTRIRDKIGIPTNQIYNVSNSGSGFTGVGDASFQNMIAGYTGNKADITDILFIGGINDALPAFADYSDTYPDVTALTGAIDNIAAYIRTNYPNAIVHTAYIGGTLTSSTMFLTNHPTKAQEWAKWAWTVYAQGKGWNVLNTWNPLHLSPDNYNADGIHPSELYGVPAIGDEVVSAFNNKRTPLNRPVKSQLIWDTTTAIDQESSSMHADFGIQDDMVTITIPDGYFMIRRNTVFSNNPVKIATFNDFAQIRGRYTTTCLASYRGFNGDTMVHMARASLIFEDGSVYLRLVDVNAQGTAYLTYTADASDFSAITFFAITPLVIPLWNIN